MQSLYYSAIGILAIIIHLIINHDMFSKPKEKDNSTIKYYHLYLVSVLFYFIIDALWGFLDYLGNTKLLYADTAFYYLIMGFSTIFCCRYIIEFLNLNKLLGRTLKTFGLLFCFFEIILLIVNLFKPIFFYFDSYGNYHAGVFRNVSLLLQVFMFLCITLISSSVVIKNRKDSNKRNFTIIYFGLAMTVTVITQTFFPFLPLYSIGLVTGTCILHTFIQENIRKEQYEVLESLSEILYSMHVIDLKNDTVEEFNAVHEVKQIVNHKHGAVEMMKQIMTVVSKEEYLEEALKFSDLTTVADRMKNKKIISGEFIGIRTGWYLASFITLEADNEGKPTKVIFTTRIIDEEKRQKEKLIRTTKTDELTGLLNRRAYEEAIYNHNDIPEEEEFIYISIDINGLKIINDTKGHTAGDELIIGACECMKKIFNPYGYIYRIGGDEFVTILFCSITQIADILKDFDRAVENWKGELIDSISVSYGWISKHEEPGASTRQLGAIAEKRMYEAKSAYYRKQGFDRRGQQDAHKALCESYTKILKINITKDTFKIVNINEDEQTEENVFSNKISEWLVSFGESGQVHPEDLEEYLKMTNLQYMKDYFRENRNALHIFYRRKFGNEFKPVMMEIIPANDYSNENQNLFLYVKNIGK